MAKEILQAKWLNDYVLVYQPTLTVHFKTNVIVNQGETFIMVQDDEVKATLGPGQHVLNADTLSFLGEFDKGRALPIQVYFVKQFELPGHINITPSLFNIGKMKVSDEQNAQEALLRIQTNMNVHIKGLTNFYQKVISLKLENDIVTVAELMEALNTPTSAVLKDLVSKARGSFINNIPAMNEYASSNNATYLSMFKEAFAKYGLEISKLELSAVPTALGLEAGAFAKFKEECHQAKGGSAASQGQANGGNAPARRNNNAPASTGNKKLKLHRKGGYVVMLVFGIIGMIIGGIARAVGNVVIQQAVDNGAPAEEIENARRALSSVSYIFYGGLILFAAGLALIIVMSIKNKKIKAMNK